LYRYAPDDDDDAPGSKKRKGGGGGKSKSKKSKKEDSEEEREEEEENNTNSDDDTEERVYAACKPLSGMAVLCAAGGYPEDGVNGNAVVGGGGDEETVAAEPLVKLDRKIFYGHDGYYLLFRLHQHLYERLSTARASAASMSQQFGQKAQPEEVRATKEREIHNDFLRLLFKLLNGTVESSSFEDACRTLLGANSYVLFTLDKLIYKIVKQIQSNHADETAAKLLQLSEYESARTAPFVEGIYHANASVLMLDEACYRFGEGACAA
jgi:paired amphipathic helix protein Sin3a